MPPDNVAEVEQETETETIHDTVSKAYELLEEGDDDGGDGVATDKAPPDKDPGDDGEGGGDQSDKGDQSDGEQPDKSDKDTKADTGDEAGAKSDTESDSDTESGAKTTEAPEHWTDDDKTMFAAQTPEAREFIRRRHDEMEADYTRKTQENSGLAKEYEPVDAIMAPFSQHMAQIGISKAEVIRRWAATENNLNIDPVGAIKQLATFYKVDLSQLSASQPEGADAYFNGGDEHQDDPRVTKLETTVNTLQSSIANDALSRANQQIEGFKTAKNDKGDLIRPHFDELIADITQMVAIKRQAGQAIDLESIYDQAVWANPTTRAKLQTSQQTADETDRKKKELADAAKKKEKADKAKVASKSVKSSKEVGATGGGADNKNSTVGQDVRAAYETLENNA
jgi:hypothetical protein